MSEASSWRHPLLLVIFSYEITEMLLEAVLNATHSLTPDLQMSKCFIVNKGDTWWVF